MAMKTCKKCNIEKTIDNFSKHSGTKDKLDNRCKECVKKVQTDKNKEKCPTEKDIVETDVLNNDWQGGKYNGSVFQRIVKNKTTEDSKVYIVSISGKQTTFNPKNYNNQDECLKGADEYKKQKSDELKLTSNKYKIILEHGKPKYLIIQLSKNFVTLCDYSQLEFIKNNNFYVSKSSSENGKQYCFYNEDGNNKRFHGYITGYDMVDHINRYPLDNRSCNLRKTTFMENNRNRTNTNKTSLMTGVTFNHKDEAWRGRIKINGKEFNKQFAVNTYGYEESKQMAINLRQDQAKLTDNFVNKEGEKDLNKHPEYDLRKEEYETIMNMYAGDFLWH